MNVISKPSVCFCVVSLCIAAAVGCGRKTSYKQMEVGPHGQMREVRTVQIPEEQLAERDATMGYIAHEDDLATVQKSWPKLTPEQRASIVHTVREMTGEVPNP